ncbi:MAG: tRNA pseudouridine(55) synthase TruB, partial [Alphaproteobacteria bacterium RIFOXYD12_FULL_60_8]
MARNRNGLPISGWIVLDKPLGLSSAQALSKVQRLLNAKKAGHGGTLDPLATGVLALAFGKATKTTAYVMDGLKEYRFTVTFGQATSTEDGEGEVIETSSVRPSTEEVERLLPGFVGDIAQTPPAFSALKVNGQRAYKLAREGLAPEMKSRIVRIEDVRLVSRPDPDHAEFLVRCGKGTYVRSLGRDIAKAAGTCGHISALRRTVCGPFAEANAFSLEKLEELVHIAPQSMYLLPI